MTLVIDSTGGVRCVYDEAIDLHALGELHIQRASLVEPDEQGRWWASLDPVNGPKLGPFIARRAALNAESIWLKSHWLIRPGNLPHPRKEKSSMHLRLLPLVLLIVVLFILLQVISCLDVFLHAEPSMHNAAKRSFMKKSLYRIALIIMTIAPSGGSRDARAHR
jgi:hypothetical protein